MTVVTDRTETINPRTMPRPLLARELQALLRGVRTPHEAEERIRKRFLPKPQVWVQERGFDHWGVLLNLGPGEESQSYYITKT